LSLAGRTTLQLDHVNTTDLTTEAKDKQRIEPMLEALSKLENQFVKAHTLLADNGY